MIIKLQPLCYNTESYVLSHGSEVSYVLSHGSEVYKGYIHATSGFFSFVCFFKRYCANNVINTMPNILDAYVCSG